MKLHLYFDEPIKLSSVQIDSCGSKIDPKMSVFLNFDQWVLRADQTQTTDTPDALTPKKVGEGLLLDGIDKTIDVRSLTFNFETNSGFKLCGLNLRDPKGEPIGLKTPTLVAGSIEASSTLEPKTAYDPIFLFDSRFEYGWASQQQAKDVDLNFRFDQPQRIEKLRIWNGYQRSVTHCVSNSRAKTVKITGDAGYSAEISLKDTLGSQLITLPKPFEGKQLKFSITDSFLGKSYKDLVISEIRFFDGKDWLMIDPTGKLKATLAANRAQFAKAKVEALLNDSYTTEPDSSPENTDLYSTLRLRADGSFYLSGQSVEEGSSFFALGNYEIKESDETKGIKLKLFGLHYITYDDGDCNGCGRDYNLSGTQSQDGERIFQEFFTLKPAPNNAFEVLNAGGGKKIKFTKIKLTRQSDSPWALSSF